MRASFVWIAGAALITGLGLPTAGAQTMPVFGPKQYTRTAGAPQTFTSTSTTVVRLRVRS